MDEFRVTGIVISSIDYKEKDKLVTLITLELGKITAVLKGVKNKNAKLKFAGQLFCFAQFLLVKRGEFHTIINAEQIESFYELTQNYSKFLVGQTMLEVSNIIMQPSIISETYFLQLLKLLRVLLDDNSNENIVLLKFLLQVLEQSGYGLNFAVCSECKMPLHDQVFFNFDLGYFTCKACAASYHYEFTKQQFQLLKIIHNASMEQLNTIKQNNANLWEMVAVLSKNFEQKLNKKVKTLVNYYALQ